MDFFSEYPSSYCEGFLLSMNIMSCNVLQTTRWIFFIIQFMKSTDLMDSKMVWRLFVCYVPQHILRQLSNLGQQWRVFFGIVITTGWWEQLTS